MSDIQEKNSLELKDRIIDAVIEEFNDKGLKFTMEDIAKRLNISKRTLYTVVREKEGVFLEAVDRVFKAIKESEREILEDDSMDVLEKLKKLLVVLPQKYRTMDYRQLYGLKYKFPKIYQKIENRLETEWEPTFQLMELAMSQGRIGKVNLPVFQAIFSGTIEYYISRSVLIDSNIGYEEALQQMLDILFDGICIREE